MAEIEISEENALTLAELKEKLVAIKKRDKELGFRATKSKEYLDKFAKLSLKQVNDLKKKLNELGIPRLKDRHIVKIIDIMPEDLDSLKMIFAGENVTIKQDDLKRILECLK